MTANDDDDVVNDENNVNVNVLNLECLCKIESIFKIICLPTQILLFLNHASLV